ncbi:hypothetical protein C1H46_027874 [Malus baccata]|uniref:Uncharacterized protein n=1 Tax=Malus baccata TaxID=106549 RepID=A0A540LJR7_MALBA|nr:hypothetical protein C1H46_027874 [Malus baccata]
MITWVSQSVSYRVLWHSVHLLFLRSLSPSLAVYVCGLMDGGGHTANRVLLDSLCKTLVSVYMYRYAVLDPPQDTRGPRIMLPVEHS